MEQETTQTASDKFTSILGEQLGCRPEDIGPGTKLEDLGADSLDKVEITMAVEEDFGLDIRGDDAENLEQGTVGEWVRYIVDNQ